MKRLVKIRSYEILNKKHVYFRIRWDPLTGIIYNLQVVLYKNKPSPPQPYPLRKRNMKIQTNKQSHTTQNDQTQRKKTPPKTYN